MDQSRKQSLHELRWKVVEDNIYDGPDHLNLETGEILIVTFQSQNDDMWYGKKGIEKGWFPRNCVTEYKSGTRYIVKNDYNGNLDENELTVKEGDVVEMISLCKNGWIWVKFGDREGFIPERYTMVDERDTEIVNSSIKEHTDETVGIDYQHKMRKIKEYFETKSQGITSRGGYEHEGQHVNQNPDRYMNQIIPDFTSKRSEGITSPGGYEHEGQNVNQNPDRYMNQIIPDFTSKRPEGITSPGGYEHEGQHVNQNPDRYMNQIIPDFTSKKSEGITSPCEYNEQKGQHVNQNPDRYMNQNIPDFTSKRSKEKKSEFECHNRSGTLMSLPEYPAKGAKGIPPRPRRTNSLDVLAKKDESTTEFIVTRRSYSNDINIDFRDDEDDAYAVIDESQIKDLRTESDQNMTTEGIKHLDPPPRPPRLKAGLDWVKGKISQAMPFKLDTFKGYRDVNELRIVLLGRTGSGKSATGNSIMSSVHFESKPASGSITKQCKRAENFVNGRKIVVVDTPGLFDTSLNEKQIHEEIIKCIQMSLPGPHIFLLVMQITRFTNEEIETFQRIFDYFGTKMCNYAIVTFTRFDDLEMASQTLDDYITKGTQSLKSLLERCQNRCFAFNNHAPSANQSSKVNELIIMIDQIIKANKGSHYTDKMYKQAEANLKRKIEVVTKQKEIEKKREIEKIESKFVNDIKQMKQENAKLSKSLECQIKLKEEVRKDKKKAKDEIRRMQDEIKQIDKKHNIELYKAKEQEKMEKEQHARNLEAKEKETLKMLQTMQQKLVDAECKIKNIESDKNNELKKYQEQHKAEVERQFRQIIEESNKRVDTMLETIKLKDIANENLRAEMNDMMESKEAKLAELQKTLRNQKDEADANFRKQIEYQKIHFEKQQADLMQRQKRYEQENEKLLKSIQDDTRSKIEEETKKREALMREHAEQLKKERMEMQKQKNAEIERTRQAMEHQNRQAEEGIRKEIKELNDLFEQRELSMNEQNRKNQEEYERNLKEVNDKCKKLEEDLKAKKSCTIS